MFYIIDLKAGILPWLLNSPRRTDFKKYETPVFTTA